MQPLKFNRTEDASWPLNVENMQMLPSACFILFNQYLRREKLWFWIPQAQPSWFALYAWRAEKSWLVMYRILSTDISAMVMTSLKQTAGHKMTALMVVFSRLSNASFKKSSREIEWRTAVCMYIYSPRSIDRLPYESSPLFSFNLFSPGRNMVQLCA